MKYFKISALTLLVFILILQGCSSTVYQTNIKTDLNKKYDTEFPYRDSSPILEKVAETIHRISSIVFYEAYVYNKNSKLELKDINIDDLETNAIEKIFFNKTSSGTATTIYSENRKLALLTCNHIIDFPETIITYWADEKGVLTDFVKSISVKKNENIYAVGFPELGRLKILASDSKSDLALLGITFSVDYPGKFPTFSFPIGKSDRLNWGSFVYMFGFPMNYKMVSRAIVSRPNNNDDGLFLIDGVVNRGFSGGLVLAIRDGIPNIELVGIIRSAPKDILYSLHPEELEDNKQYDLLVPYKGKIYLNAEEKIKYGITKVISTEMIEEFLTTHQKEISKEGYGLINFFTTK